MSAFARSARRSLTSSVILVVALVTGVAFAGAGTDQLKAKQGELTRLIEKPRSAEGDAQLQKTFDAVLDYEALAKDSLASTWDGLSPEQRTEFQGLLRTLVQRAYTNNIRDTLAYDVSFTGESPVEKGQLVKTVAAHKTDKRKEPIHIDYVMHQKGSAWLVRDILTEGSSLVSNYQSQFRKLIEKDGFPGLIQRMKKKVAEGAS